MWSPISNKTQPLSKRSKSDLLDEYIHLLHYWGETKVEEITQLNAAILDLTPENDADIEKELEDAEEIERKLASLPKAVSRN